MGVIPAPGYLTDEYLDTLSRSVELLDTFGCGLFHRMNYNGNQPWVSHL